MNKGTKFCPECGSKDIEWVIPQDWSKWQCRECGYIGVLIIEDGKIADQIRKDYLERNKNKGKVKKTKKA